jgi:acetyltransferase-like isoleucine patch superfamily enzyme
MISRHAVLETDSVGVGVRIDEFAIVRAGATIGDGAVIHPHVVIAAGVVIGAGVEIFPGAMVGKEPKGAGATSRPLQFERRVRIGAGCSIGPHAVIFYDVEIGDHSLVGDGASIREQCRIGSHCVIGRYAAINYNATIGDRTRIMDLAVVTGNCRIGSDVFVSMHVSMANDNSVGRNSYSERMVGPVIHDGAMIGTGAILLPNTVIGAGAIVGAGAVVNRDVPDHVMVVGVPCRVVRHLGAERPGEER